jgi:hypothetical protein
MRIVVLFEETGHADSPLAKDSAVTVEAAKAASLEVFTFSSDFDLFGTAEEALEHVPVQEPTWGVWVGFVASPERYSAVYEAARAKGITLLNRPVDSQLAMEFDRFYPRLGPLTPRSAIISDLDGCAAAIAELGLPLFIKGVVRSARTKGWRACVAENEAEVRELVTNLLGMTERSRGRVVLRQLMPLRHARRTEHGFPLGREYRVILHGAEVLGHGYYWEGDDPLAALSSDEERCVLELARKASLAVGAPFITVDVGELEAGGWIVIETGDPQFAGWHGVSRQGVFTRLAALPSLVRERTF